MKPRQYQIDATRAAIEMFQGGTDSALVVLPTGTGKTVVCGTVCQEVKRIHRRTGKSLLLAHRYELIRQNAAELTAMGLDVAVEMGGERARSVKADVVVGTVQTLTGGRLAAWNPYEFDCLLTDECHHALSPTYRNIYANFQDFWHYGTTATAGRGDKKNLGRVYQEVAYQYNLRKAIDDGWLAKITPRACRTDVDLRDIRTTGKNGDLNSGDLSERISPHIESLCSEVSRLVDERQFIIFTPDVGSAYAVANCLSKMGVPSKYVAGNGGRWGMNKAERRDTLKEFRRLGFQGIINCDLLEEGWNCPWIECVVNMRPTLSPWKFMQRVGRGTRLCEEIGKTDCLVIDFDWNCDEELSRNLCSMVDLYNDELNLPEAVRREANIKLASKSYDDIMQAVSDAEETLRYRGHLDIAITGNSPNSALTELKVWSRNPVDFCRTLGITLTPSDKDKRNPSTDNQRWALRKEGVSNPENLSFYGAKKVLGKIEKRRASGLASIDQVEALIARGMPVWMAHAAPAGSTFNNKA